MTPIRIKSISDFHRLVGLPPPEHPLISIIDYSKIMKTAEENTLPVVFDFYSISVKRDLDFKMFYGQQEYDFDEGVMFFMAPRQVLLVEAIPGAAFKHSGFLLLIHPDLMWNTALAKKIKGYKFFHYSANGSLFLSPKEESTVKGIVDNIELEYHSNIDKFSQDIIIAHLEVFLNYSERFYQRQFITRRKTNHRILERVEALLNGYFDSDDFARNGLPAVAQLATDLNISPDYLSEVLKATTGKMPSSTSTTNSLKKQRKNYPQQHLAFLRLLMN